MIRHFSLFGALGATLLFHAVCLAAERHPAIQLNLEPCADVVLSEVRHVLEVELGAAFVPENMVPDGRTTLVRVSCEGATTGLHVDDPVTGKSLDRSVALRDAPKGARSRLLGLAISELIYASWTELAVNPNPEVPPAGRRPPEEVVRDIRTTIQKKIPQVLNPPQRFRMIGIGSRRWFFSHGGVLWGGGLRAADDPFPMIGWSLDAIAEHGVVKASLGNVYIDTATAGGSVVVHRELSVVSFRAGLGLRIGVARMRGEPYSAIQAQGRSIAAPWGWPLGVFALSIVPIRPLVLEAQGEVGYVILPLGGAVGGGKEITLEGPWAGVQFGVGVLL